MMSAFKSRTVLFQVLSAIIYLQNIQCPTVMMGHGFRNLDKRRNITQAPDKDKDLEDFPYLPELDPDEEDTNEENSTLATLIPALMIGGTLVFIGVMAFIMYRLMRRRPARASRYAGRPGERALELPAAGKALTNQSNSLARAGKRTDGPVPAPAPAPAPAHAPRRERKSVPDKPPAEGDAHNKKRKTNAAEAEKQNEEESMRKKLKVERARIRNSSDSKLLKNSCKLTRRSASDKASAGIEERKSNMKYLSQINEQLGYTRIELTELKDKHEIVRRQVSDLVTEIKRLHVGKKVMPVQLNSPARSGSSVLNEMELQMEKFLKEAREYRPICDTPKDDHDSEEVDRCGDSRAATWSSDELSNFNTSHWSEMTYIISERRASEKQEDDSSCVPIKTEMENQNRNISLCVASNSPAHRLNTTITFPIGDIEHEDDTKVDTGSVNCIETDKRVSSETSNILLNDFDNSKLRGIVDITNKKDLRDALTEQFFSKVPDSVLVKLSKLDVRNSENDIYIDAKKSIYEEHENKQDDVNIRSRENGPSGNNETLKDVLTTAKDTSCFMNQNCLQGRRSRSTSREITEYISIEGHAAAAEEEEEEEGNQNKNTLQRSCTSSGRGPSESEFEQLQLAKTVAEAANALQELPTTSAATPLKSEHHDIQQSTEKCLLENYDSTVEELKPRDTELPAPSVPPSPSPTPPPPPDAASPGN